ncbi:MAG: metallophosphoesterase [Candidatus Dormibacteria bacterium]
MRPGRPDPARTVAVIGDIGGHADELTRALTFLGADPDTASLPEQVNALVQVGDLIDCGPDSEGCVSVAARLIQASPSRWHQLIGNHEAAHLGGPEFQPFGETANPAAVRLIQQLWHDRQLRVAVCVDDPLLGPTLITHAGLTRDTWLALGAPRDPAETAAALERAARTHPEMVFRPGRLLGGERIDFSAGPLWADPRHELLASWAGQPMPFSQIHGHASPWAWSHPASQASLPQRTWLDTPRKHSWVPLGDKWIVGIDPGLGQHAGIDWEPLILPGATIRAVAR